MNSTIFRRSVILLVLALVLSACAQSAPPTVANQPESTQAPVAAVVTATERPTDVPLATAAVAPTETAPVTATPQASETTATAETAAPVEASAGTGIAPLLGNLGDHS